MLRPARIVAAIAAALKFGARLFAGPRCDLCHEPLGAHRALGAHTTCLIEEYQSERARLQAIADAAPGPKRLLPPPAPPAP